MDQIKAAYGYVKSTHEIATNWVAAHPVATVNAIATIVVAKVILTIVF